VTVLRSIVSRLPASHRRNLAYVALITVSCCQTAQIRSRVVVVVIPAVAVVAVVVVELPTDDDYDDDDDDAGDVVVI